MVTYSNNKNENVVYIPGDFKPSVHLVPIEDGSTTWHLSNVRGFKCTFYTNSKKKKVFTRDGQGGTERMIYVDDDTYVAALNSEDLGPGNLTVLLEVEITDDAFEDDVRNEIIMIPTNLKIKRP